MPLLPHQKDWLDNHERAGGHQPAKPKNTTEKPQPPAAVNRLAKHNFDSLPEHQLRALLELAYAERDHWKAQHDAQVRRSRALVERDDIPLERVRAYTGLVEAHTKVLTALQQIATPPDAQPHENYDTHKYLLKLACYSTMRTAALALTRTEFLAGAFDRNSDSYSGRVDDPLIQLFLELNTLRWASDDAGFESGINAVQKHIAEIVLDRTHSAFQWKEN